MKTRLLSGKKPADIAEAGRLLASGEVVGIPTETVYGLAADAFNAQAALRVFAAKGRPADNPLIVHITDLSQLTELAAYVPDTAYKLAEKFWPGPMTLLMYKKSCIPDEVTAGLKTVGIRMPSHPVARAVIEAAGVPLAAPSANTSGKPSPTTARHVLDDMDGKIAAVVDGGACSVGVESTVIDLTGGGAQVLRPGAVTEEMIAEVLGSATTDPSVERGLSAGERPKAPGMKYRHYAPKAPVLLLEGPPENTAAALRRELRESDGALVFSEYIDTLRPHEDLCPLGESWDHASHARRLFAALRQFDSTSAQRILAQCPRARGAEAGAVNRLRKAAGFQSLDCRGGRYVVGVTGRTGCGKSALASALRARGAYVLDADAIYRELLQTDGQMLAAIGERFPGTVHNGVLDRKELGRRIFSVQQARLDLNAIAHPAVFREVGRRIEKGPAGLVLLDVPLLFESGIDRFCDLTVGLLANRRVSLRRIVERDGITEERARARLFSQPDNAFYRRRCDVLLKNDASLEDFNIKIEEFCTKYLTF